MILVFVLLQAQVIEPLIPELMKSVGAAGVLIGVLFLTGAVVSGRTAEKWEARYDALREREAIKDQKLVEEIVPLLTRGVEAMREFTESQGRDE